MKFSRSALILLSTLTAATVQAVPTENPRNPTADREAILAMQGEYEVDFAFEETVLLAEGYERKPAKRTGAYEVVLVIEDSPGRISLQHLLVSKDGGHVTKHWRQDWEYEAARRFEFSSDQTWRVRELPAAVTQGAWTQCVYEVSDAPRYCGTGRWNHKYGVATWTSDRSWRPLPRREYTTRDDYNALNVENRHTIVPGGWTHEQDNTKTVRAADGSTQQTIAREFGFNDYRKTANFDFQPAHEYWGATRDYWARIRSAWASAFDVGDGVHLKTPVDGMPIIEATFDQADEIARGGTVPDADIRAVFARWVAAPQAQPSPEAAAP